MQIARDTAFPNTSSAQNFEETPKKLECSQNTVEHYYSTAQLLGQIDEIARDCATYGWDGEEAEAVSSGVVAAAKKLVAKLPMSQPLPEPCPDADGEIGMEWHIETSRWGVVTIGSHKIHYAIKFGGGHRSTGSMPLSDTTLEYVLNGISFLYRF